MPEILNHAAVLPGALASRGSKWRRWLSAPFRRQKSSGPKILILTPVKDAADFLLKYFELLFHLSYPHDLISIGLLESDSTDTTALDMRGSCLCCAGSFAALIFGKRTLDTECRHGSLAGRKKSKLPAVPSWPGEKITSCFTPWRMRIGCSGWMSMSSNIPRTYWNNCWRWERISSTHTASEPLEVQLSTAMPGAIRDGSIWTICVRGRVGGTGCGGRHDAALSGRICTVRV